MKAFARNTDPSTSHSAAHDFEQHVTKSEMTVLNFIASCGNHGATIDEIVSGTGMQKVSASPRLKPLEKKNMVKATDQKRIGVSGKRQIVWVAK